VAETLTMGRFTSTLLLFVVFAGLLGYIYFGNRDGSSTADEKEKAFAAVTAEDVEEVEIKSESGERSRVQKTDGTWSLVEPVQVAADENELTSIAGSVASLDIQRVVDENAADLKQYGLDPARIEVAFRKKGEKEPKRILLGERTPTGSDMYARLPDQKRVFLVSSFLDATFNKDTFALREKSVIKFDRDKVDRIEVNAGARSATLAKSGTEWRIDAPIMARADFAAVEGALERLSTARMQGIVAPESADLKKLKLEPPVASFAAISGSARATLLLGETENALIYAKDASRPVVFTVAPTLYTDLIRDLQEFRRKDLFDSRSFTTNRIEFRRGSETIVLEKGKTADGKEGWKTADGKDVDSAKAEDLLTKVSGLRAESFDAATPAALKSPALTVVVRFDDKKMEQVVFARAGSDVVASRSDEPGTAKVLTMSFDDAMKAIDAVK
jgi:hypothetical protein